MIDYAKYAPISQSMFSVFFAHHIRMRFRSDERSNNYYLAYANSIGESSDKVIEALNTGRATQRIIEDMGLYSEELIEDVVCSRRVKKIQYWGIDSIAQRS